MSVNGCCPTETLTERPQPPALPCENDNLNKRLEYRLIRKSVQFFSVLDSLHYTRVFTSSLVNTLHGAVQRVLNLPIENRTNQIWFNVVTNYYRVRFHRAWINQIGIWNDPKYVGKSEWKTNGNKLWDLKILEWPLQRNFIERSWKLMVRNSVEEQRERF